MHYERVCGRWLKARVELSFEALNGAYFPLLDYDND